MQCLRWFDGRSHHKGMVILRINLINIANDPHKGSQAINPLGVGRIRSTGSHGGVAFPWSCTEIVAKNCYAKTCHMFFSINDVPWIETCQIFLLPKLLPIAPCLCWFFSSMVSPGLVPLPWTLSALRRREPEVGIIFCSSKMSVDALHAKLRSALGRLGLLPCCFSLAGTGGNGRWPPLEDDV